MTRSWSERARREANKGDLYRDKRKALRNGFRKTSLACLSNSENRTSEKFSQALIRALNTESVIAFPLPIANELKGERMKSPKLTTPLCRRTLALAHLATQTWPPREGQHNRECASRYPHGTTWAERLRASARVRTPTLSSAGQPPRRAWPTKGQGREENAPGGFRFRPAGTVGPMSLNTPSRTSAVHAPPARPRPATQTLCRRAPIQSSAASRQNDATKFFATPVLVRAMRRLQSRLPTRTGGR